MVQMAVYRPGEDSYLLKDHVKSLDLEEKDVLDMGAGTGIIAVEAAKQGANVTAADINPEALEVAREKARDEEVYNCIEFTESDLFEDIDDEFDFIVFNPPYLAGDRQGQKDALVGGDKGTEIIERFLSEAERYLKPDGRVFFIASSLSEIESLEDKHDIELVDSEDLWFETLYLFEAGNSFL